MSPTAYEKQMRRLISMDATTLFAAFLEAKEALDAMEPTAAGRQNKLDQINLISQVASSKYGVGFYISASQPA